MTLQQTPDATARATLSPDRSRAHWHSIFVIVLIVLVANSTYLVHIFNPDPINQVSGLGITLHPGLLPGGNNIDPNIGFTAQALGHRAAVDWLHGQIPWWNPYEGVGAPLAGEMQSAALFPLDAFNLLPGGQVYFRVVLEVVAGIAAYLLIRRFTVSNLAATVGGIAFALNGTFSWLFHAPGNPIAFAPLVLLGLEWAREGALTQRRRGWALIAVALALSLYAGFPEVAFVDGLLAAIWCVVRGIGLSRRMLRSYLESVAIGVGVAGLLAAPLAITFVDYLPYANVGAHTSGFGNASLSATTALPAQIMPYLFGPILGFLPQDSHDLLPFWGNIGGYLGIAISLFALIGAFGRTFRPLRVALALWVVVGLARLVGVGWALAILNAIPGVRSVAFFRYAPPSWELAVVVLGALGLDDLIRRSTQRRIVIGSGFVMVALCALSWHVAQPVFHAIAKSPNSSTWALVSAIWALSIVISVVVIGCVPDFQGSHRGSARLRPLLLSIIVVVDVAAMFVTPQFSAPRQAVLDSKPISYLQQHLGTSRFFTLGPLLPNYGSYFGLGSVAVNDLPIPKTYSKYITSHLDTNVNPLVFTGTSEQNASGPTPAEEFVSHIAAYRYLGVKYLLLPAGMILPPGHNTELHRVFGDETTQIDELSGASSLFSSVTGGCTVTPKNETNVVVNCRRPSKILYRELYMPGWHVQANGEAVTVQPNGPLFQSVAVERGTTILSFGYTPPHADLGLVACLVGLLLLILATPQAGRKARELATRLKGSAPG